MLVCQLAILISVLSHIKKGRMSGDFFYHLVLYESAPYQPLVIALDDPMFISTLFKSHVYHLLIGRHYLLVSPGKYTHRCLITGELLEEKLPIFTKECLKLPS
jgi:hypothetical protein